MPGVAIRIRLARAAGRMSGSQPISDGRSQRMSQDLRGFNQVAGGSTARGRRFRRADLVAPCLSQIARHWWIESLLGALGIVAAVLVLKFDEASVATGDVLT